MPQSCIYFGSLVLHLFIYFRLIIVYVGGDSYWTILPANVWDTDTQLRNIQCSVIQHVKCRVLDYVRVLNWLILRNRVSQRSCSSVRHFPMWRILWRCTGIHFVTFLKCAIDKKVLRGGRRLQQRRLQTQPAGKTAQSAGHWGLILFLMSFINAVAVELVWFLSLCTSKGKCVRTRGRPWIWPDEIKITQDRGICAHWGQLDLYLL